MSPVFEGRMLWFAAAAVGVPVAASTIAWDVPRSVARAVVVVAVLVVLLTLLSVFVSPTSLSRNARLGPVLVMVVGSLPLLSGAGWWWSQSQGHEPIGTAFAHRACFDYGLSSEFDVSIGSTVVRLRFSVGDRNSIYVYQGQGGVAAVVKLGGLQTGERVKFSAFTTATNNAALVGIGESFAIRTTDMHFLIGKIQSVTNRGFGDATDEVCFSYALQPTSSGDLQAL